MTRILMPRRLDAASMAIIACALLGLAAAPGAVRASDPAATEPAATTAPASAGALTVAVLDFDADTPGSPNLGKQIGELLTAALGDGGDLTLVDRATLARTLQEHELSLTGLTRPDEAVKVGQLTGAKLLVTGKAFALDKRLYLTAKVIGTETSRVEGVLVSGRQDADVGELVAQLAAKLQEKVRTAGPQLVAEPDAADPVATLRVKLAGRRLPKVAVDVTEQHFADPAAAARGRKAIDPPVETEMRAVLADVGFAVANPDAGNPADQGVDVVVSGEAFSEFAARVGNLVSCSARAEVRVADRRTGRLLLSDRVTTRAADLSEQIAAKSALQKAGRALALRLADRLAAEAPPATAPATQR